ncbi:MAG: 3-oxoacyl-ACP synthase III [Thermodesulfobacteriota bacterium]
MRFENVSILGVTHVDAPHRVTSQYLEDQLAPAKDRLGLKTNVLETLTGIVARRFWDPDVAFSTMATMAAEKVLEQTGLDRRRIGILLSTSVCKDYIEPSMASLIHGNLKLPPECMNMDIGNACLGFLNGMDVIGNMIERGQVDYGLIANGEGSRYAVECTLKRMLAPEADIKTLFDNFATLTLGSGAAAMILARSDLAPEGHRVVADVTLAATQHNRLCVGQPDCMTTDASGLLKAGLKLAVETWEKATRELGWRDEDIDHYMVHQIGSMHVTKFCQAIGIEEKKLYKIFPEFGNTGPASIPMALCKALEAGLVKKGQRLGLLGIGSGLNCTMMEVIW